MLTIGNKKILFLIFLLSSFCFSSKIIVDSIRVNGNLILTDNDTIVDYDTNQILVRCDSGAIRGFPVSQLNERTKIPSPANSRILCSNENDSTVDSSLILYDRSTGSVTFGNNITIGTIVIDTVSYGMQNYSVLMSSRIGSDTPTVEKLADNGDGSFGVYECAFNDGDTNQVFFSISYPPDIDTSNQASFGIMYIPQSDDTGHIIIHAEYAIYKNGDHITTSDYDIDTIEILSGSSNDVSTYILDTIPAGGIGQSSFSSFRIARIGDLDGDTYINKVFIVKLYLLYRKRGIGFTQP